MSFLSKLAVRLDSWVNLVTGLGDPSVDKMMAANPVLIPALDDMTLEALWRGSDFARRIVGARVERALKQGFGLSPNSSDTKPENAQQEIEELLKAADGFAVVEKFIEAWCWGRLYGFGAVIMGVEGSGGPEAPLDDEKATRLMYLMVVDGRELVPADYYDDPDEDKFGEPETYRLQPVSSSTVVTDGAVIHESRIIRFGGALTARRDKRNLQGRDFSVLQPVINVLRQAESNWNGVCYLMTDIAQAVFKIDKLSEMISGGTSDLITTRLEAMQLGRSVARAVVLDKTEEFERKATPLAGVPELLEQTWKRLASAADMPLTVLMGVSPAGLNATGESDLRLWYDSIQVERERMLAPRLERVVRLVARTLSHGDPDGWSITWPPLWQLNAAEKAELYQKTAAADHIYVTDGVLLPEEIGLSRFARPEFDGAHIKIDVDARNKALKAAVEELINPTPEPLPGTLPPHAAPPRQLTGRKPVAAPSEKMKPSTSARSDAFNPDEPRDEKGEWTGGGGAGSSGGKSSSGGGGGGSGGGGGRKLAIETKIRPEPADPEKFHAAFAQAFANSPYKNHVSHYTVEQLKSMKTFMSADGKSGIAVHDHGDGRVEGTALFNQGGEKGAGLALLRHAVEHGGVNYLEAYGDVLRAKYESLGFKVETKSDFNPEYAAKDWDYQRFPAASTPYYTFKLDRAAYEKAKRQ